MSDILTNASSVTESLDDWTSVNCEVTNVNLPSKDPGQYAVTYKSSVVDALSADNYVFEDAAGALVINKQEIKFSGVTVSGKIYDGTTTVDSEAVDVSNIVIEFWLNGTAKTVDDTNAIDYSIVAEYEDKNVGAAKKVNLTFELGETSGKYYTVKAGTQDCAYAPITAKDLVLVPITRELAFGQPLTFSKDTPSDYAKSKPNALAANEDYNHDFATGEDFSDLYGEMTYKAIVEGSDPEITYRAGSPAGNYEIVIGGFAPDASKGQVQNYNITFEYSSANVLSIDPAKMDTPEPVWDTSHPGTISWAAIDNIGIDNAEEGTFLVKVAKYYITLYKDDVLVSNSSMVQNYVEGQSSYTKDYADLIRSNGPGRYTVKVRAESSTENNASYCNVYQYSSFGESGDLYAATVTVEFANDSVSTAGKGLATPTINGAASYVMIAGETGIVLSASLKNATGYNVNRATTAFVVGSETESNPIGITISDGAKATDSNIHTAKVALSSAIKSADARKVILGLQATPATLSVNLTLYNDGAMFGYSTTAAPYFVTTPSVEAGDNITTNDYTYEYTWYYRNGAGTYTMSTETSDTYTLPLGYLPTNSKMYFAYCQVKAIRRDNGLSKTLATVKNVGAYIAKGRITDATVICDDWQYGQVHSTFGVTTNPGSAVVTYYFRKVGDTTWTMGTEPKNVGDYEVYAYIAKSNNYEEFETPVNTFSITKAKLGKPSITHSASETAPYGLASWTEIVGPKEGNAGAPIEVYYHVVIKRDGVETALVDSYTDDCEYDFTDVVTVKGKYDISVTACVKKTDDRLNCNDGETAIETAKLTISTGIHADKALTRQYDGTPTTLTAEFEGDDGEIASYQWLYKGNPIAVGGNTSTYQVTEVAQSGSYICKIILNDSSEKYSTNTTVTITKCPVDVQWTGTTFTYDSESHGVTAQLVSAVLTSTGDDVSISSISGTSNATLADGYTATAAGLSGSMANNYKLADETKSHSWSIVARTITIKADSATKVYDKTALTKQTYQITSGSLAGADAITAITMNSSVINVASVANEITANSVTIKDGATDVTDCYDITLESGTLTVTPKPVSLSWNYTTPFTYDGGAFNLSASVENACAGDVVTVSSYTGNTGINSASYTAVATGLAGAAKDNYTLTNAVGTSQGWVIEKRSITVSSKDYSRAYSGSALNSNGVSAMKLTAGTLAPKSGDAISAVTFIGSIINVGTTANAYTHSSVTIANSLGADVSDNYNISYEEGVLEITPATDTVAIIKDISTTYSKQTVSNPGARTVGVTYNSLNNGTLEYRYYTRSGETYTEIPSGNPVNAGTYYVKAFVSGDSNFYDAESDYVEFVISPKAVTLEWNETSFVYDGQWKSVTASVTNKCVGDDVSVGTYASNPLASPPQSNREKESGGYEAKAVALTGTNAANYTLTGCTTDATNWTIARSDHDLVVTDVIEIYDAQTHEIDVAYTNSENSSVTVTYEKENSDGTFAAVTENGGIPMEVGTYRAKVSVPETANYVAMDIYGHVYITKRTLTITSGTESKLYDGTALTNSTYEETGLQGTDTVAAVEFDEAAAITDYGSIPNHMLSATVERSGVDVSDNYNIVLVDGTLSIRRIPDILTITKNLNKVADGNPVTLDASEDVARNGIGSISFFYYIKNRTGQYVPILEAPKTPGTYYVVAQEAEAGNYLLSKSPYTEFVISQLDVIVHGDPTQPVKVSIQVGAQTLKFVEGEIEVGGTYESHFDVLDDSVYDIVVESGDFIETKGITVQDGIILGEHTVEFTVPPIGSGLTNSYVKVPNGDVAVVVHGLNDLFDNEDIYTDENNELVTNEHAYVDLALIVERYSEEQWSDQLSAKVAEDGMAIGYDLDTSIEKYIKLQSDEEYQFNGNIYDTTSQNILEIAFPLDETLTDKGELTIYREFVGSGSAAEYKLEQMTNLNNRVTSMASTAYIQEGYAIENGMVYIYTHLLSEFAIAYTLDADDPGDDDPGDDNPGNGDDPGNDDPGNGDDPGDDNPGNGDNPDDPPAPPDSNLSPKTSDIPWERGAGMATAGFMLMLFGLAKLLADRRKKK